MATQEMLFFMEKVVEDVGLLGVTASLVWETTRATFGETKSMSPLGLQ